jgi:teichoic acid transport system permease protein
VFVFQFVSGVIVGGAGSVLNSKGLLLNTSTPRLVYPLVSTAQAVVDLGTMLIVLFVLQLALGQPFTLWLLLLPLVLAILTVFVFGLAMAAASAAVFFRDTVNLLGYVTRIWLFLSPVLYTVDEIPAGLRKYMALNPLYPFFAILDPIFSGEGPSPLYFVWAAGWAVLALVLGAWFFLAKERDFALRIY